MAEEQTNTSQIGALVAYVTDAPVRVGAFLALVVYSPPPSELVRSSSLAGLVPYYSDIYALPRTSVFAAQVVYRTGTPDEGRLRSWWFSLDGHTFYVLDLGIEGTFVYDATTKQWAKWYTLGYSGMWNMRAGTMWGGLRVVAGDLGTGQAWVIDPTSPMDENWREMQHVVTGGIMLRGRVFVGMSALRLAGSLGKVSSDTGDATIWMRFSDNQGSDWSEEYPVTLEQGDFDEVAWRSLGSFSAPGRIMELRDIGGMLRIDGLDANLDGFDEPPQPATGGQRNG